jgi:hypothetical protein
MVTTVKVTSSDVQTFVPFLYPRSEKIATFPTRASKIIRYISTKFACRNLNVLKITERKIVKKIDGRTRRRTLEDKNKEEDRKHII